MDTFNSGEGFEIHVYNPSGEEAGICSGKLGWIAKHGHLAEPPPNIPQDVLNKLNGLNVGELRGRGAIGEKGTENIKGGKYLSAGRTLFTALNVIGLACSILGEHQAERDLEDRARKHGLTPAQQFYNDSLKAGHPDFYMTPFGPMRNPYARDRNMLPPGMWDNRT